MLNIVEKSFLITGGTGFVGKELCFNLAEKGAKLFILSRNSHQSTNNIRYVKSFSEISKEKIDVVINLAGETIAQRWTKKTKERILNSRISVTSDLIEYIKNSEHKPSLLISGSAIGFYGNHHIGEFTEDTKPSASMGFAHKVCKSWEDEALKAKKYVERVVLLRTAVVLEKNGGMLAKLLPSFRLGLGSIISNGKQPLSWIDREDLIRLLVFIIENKDINGPINACAPIPSTNETFSRALAKALNRPCFLKVPSFVFRLIFGQMADEIMLSGQKVLPKKALENGFTFLYPTVEESLNKIFKN